MYKLMKYLSVWMAAWLWLAGAVNAQTVNDFTLPGVDGSTVSLSQYKTKAAVVVIFTGNHCVYSKKYEARILKLAADYSGKNVQFLLINSNSPELSEDDNMEGMKLRAMEQGYTFPYLQDEKQVVARQFGAVKNPDVYVLVPAAAGFNIVYHGMIDDNPLMEEAVSARYLQQSIDRVLSGNAAVAAATVAQGCGIKGLDE